MELEKRKRSDVSAADVGRPQVPREVLSLLSGYRLQLLQLAMGDRLTGNILRHTQPLELWSGTYYPSSIITTIPPPPPAITIDISEDGDSGHAIVPVRQQPSLLSSLTHWRTCPWTSIPIPPTITELNGQTKAPTTSPSPHCPSPSPGPAITSNAPTLTQTFHCEVREELVPESDEELDLPAAWEEQDEPPKKKMRESEERDGCEVMDQGESSECCVVPEMVDSLSLPGNQEVGGTCVPVATTEEVLAGGEEGEVLASETADDGSSTVDQAVPAECAHQHALMANPAPCRQQQGGGGSGGRRGGGGGEEGSYTNQQHSVLSPDCHHYQTSPLPSPDQQVVPDEVGGGTAGQLLQASLYEQDSFNKSLARTSIETSHLPRPNTAEGIDKPKTETRAKRRLNFSSEDYTPYPYYQHHGCQPRDNGFPSTVLLNLSRPRLRLGLSRCQRPKPLHRSTREE